MTILVVDGYNAIYGIKPLKKKIKSGLLNAREAVLAISKEYARKSGYITDVKVVFDGDEKYRSVEALHTERDKAAVFSEKGEGDNKIIKLVAHYSRLGKVVLASNDNYVRNNSRSYGAVIIDVAELDIKTRKINSTDDKEEKSIDKSVMDDITKEYRKELGIED